jgi:hypothetical protein
MSNGSEEVSRAPDTLAWGILNESKPTIYRHDYPPSSTAKSKLPYTVRV